MKSIGSSGNSSGNFIGGGGGDDGGAVVKIAGAALIAVVGLFKTCGDRVVSTTVKEPSVWNKVDPPAHKETFDNYHYERTDENYHYEEKNYEDLKDAAIDAGQDVLEEAVDEATTIDSTQDQ